MTKNEYFFKKRVKMLNEGNFLRVTAQNIFKTSRLKSTRNIHPENTSSTSRRNTSRTSRLSAGCSVPCKNIDKFSLD